MAGVLSGVTDVDFDGVGWGMWFLGGVRWGWEKRAVVERGDTRRSELEGRKGAREAREQTEESGRGERQSNA